MKIRHKNDCAFLYAVMLSSTAVLVPRWRRAEWLAEWKSELWYVTDRNKRAQQHSWRDREALLFCLGAFRDAMWLRRNNLGPNSRQHAFLQSALNCLLLLATAATVAIACFFLPSGPYETFVSPPDRAFLFGHFQLVAIAVLAVPSITSLALGDYPAKSGSPVRAAQSRRWIFLGIKLALILSIVFCGALDLCPLIGLQPHAMLVAYLLAFRWALADQRQRCPVCLRFLTHPLQFGQPSRILFARYGTEYSCAKGHGVLHVPEILTTYSTQRWLNVDSSCSNPSS